MRSFVLALSLALCANAANAKVDDVPTFLGCTFGAPGSALDADGETHRLYLLQNIDEHGREVILQIDADSLLDKTVLAHRKVSRVDGGELWTFGQSESEPTGTILMILPKVVPMDDGRQARTAALGQYHGSKPRNGVCVIVRGEDAVAAFAALGSKETAK